jgi:uncharacterized membrane protein YidH (DUF202 family)
MTGPERDGLQPERTDLAWSRTALAAAGCALLQLDVMVRLGLSVVTLAPAVLTGATALCLALRAGRPTTRPRTLAVIAALLTAACVTALPIAI